MVEVEKDLNSMMRREFRLHSRLAVLEGGRSDGQFRSSDLDQGHHMGQVGMRGTCQGDSYYPLTNSNKLFGFTSDYCLRCKVSCRSQSVMTPS